MIKFEKARGIPVSQKFSENLPERFSGEYKLGKMRMRRIKAKMSGGTKASTKRGY
jgi:hypothetical protein